MLGPFARVLLGGVNLVLRPFGIRARFEPPPLPLEELERMLAAQAANQKVDASAPELIRSVFELSDKRCRDVMVPRTEVVAVDVSTPPTEILRILAEESHSRIPVYRDDIDHIVGVLHARDLIPLLQHPELIVLQDLIRPAVFVPWIKPVGDLLREMQKRRIHMAMVVDEYGGFMGVVTLEDILREIVGDIADEFEQDRVAHREAARRLVPGGRDARGRGVRRGLRPPAARGRVRDARRLPELPCRQHPRGGRPLHRTTAGSSPSPRSKVPAWGESG